MSACPRYAFPALDTGRRRFHPRQCRDAARTGHRHAGRGRRCCAPCCAQYFIGMSTCMQVMYYQDKIFAARTSKNMNSRYCKARAHRAAKYSSRAASPGRGSSAIAADPACENTRWPRSSHDCVTIVDAWHRKKASIPERIEPRNGHNHESFTSARQGRWHCVESARQYCASVASERRVR